MPKWGINFCCHLWLFFVPNCQPERLPDQRDCDICKMACRPIGIIQPARDHLSASLPQALQSPICEVPFMVRLNQSDGQVQLLCPWRVRTSQGHHVIGLRGRGGALLSEPLNERLDRLLGRNSDDRMVQKSQGPRRTRRIIVVAATEISNPD